MKKMFELHFYRKKVKNGLSIPSNCHYTMQMQGMNIMIENRSTNEEVWIVYHPPKATKQARVRP